MSAEVSRRGRPWPSASEVAAQASKTLERRTQERLQQSNDALSATCDALSGRCASLQAALAQSKTRAEVLQQRVWEPNDVRDLWIRAETAEAEVSDLKSTLAAALAAATKSKEEAFLLHEQLHRSRASEEAARREVQRLAREFHASRLALLVRAARATAERDKVERSAIAMREWALEVAGAEALAARDAATQAAEAAAAAQADEDALDSTFGTDQEWEDMFCPAGRKQAEEVTAAYYGRRPRREDPWAVVAERLEQVSRVR